MTRRSVNIGPAPSDEEVAFRAALAGRQDLDYDAEGRSREPGPAPAAGQPSGAGAAPPQGARDGGTPPPSADSWLREMGAAAIEGRQPVAPWAPG